MWQNIRVCHVYLFGMCGSFRVQWRLCISPTLWLPPIYIYIHVYIYSYNKSVDVGSHVCTMQKCLTLCRTSAYRTQSYYWPRDFRSLSSILCRFSVLIPSCTQPSRELQEYDDVDSSRERAQRTHVQTWTTNECAFLITASGWGGGIGSGFARLIPLAGCCCCRRLLWLSEKQAGKTYLNARRLLSQCAPTNTLHRCCSVPARCRRERTRETNDVEGVTKKSMLQPARPSSNGATFIENRLKKIDRPTDEKKSERSLRHVKHSLCIYRYKTHREAMCISYGGRWIKALILNGLMWSTSGVKLEQ